MKTVDYLQEIITRNGLSDTNYGLAKHMGTRYGWSRTSVINYRSGKRSPDDGHCLDIADELDLPPEQVLADISAERAERLGNSELVTVWKKIGDRLRDVAAFGAVAILASGVPGNSQATQGLMAHSGSDNVYIMRTRRRRRSLWPSLGVWLLSGYPQYRTA